MKFKLNTTGHEIHALQEDKSTYSSETRDLIIQVLEEHNSCYYDNTAMCLEMICEKLYYEYGIDARYRGRTIYIGEDRIATIQVDKDGPNLVGMYGYKLLI